MKSQLVILASAALATSFVVPREGPNDGENIINGKDAKIKDFPFMASLIRGSSHLCGASIVSNKYVVTAAHCVAGLRRPDRIQVRVGTDDVFAGGESIRVSDIYVNPKYNRSTIDYDVALIKLATPLNFGPHIQPIRLIDEPAATGRESTALGYGLTEENETSRKLKYVRVPIVDRASCAKSNEPFPVTDRMVCAGLPEGGKDACGGDSGGPLTVGGALAGIVSWGIGCAQPDKPGVYTDVGNAEIRQFLLDRGEL